MKEYSVITGAAGFLGQEHSYALASVGYSLILTDLNLENLKKLKNKIKKKYPKLKIHIVVADISKENDVILIKKFILKKKIKVSVLVNNAAINPTMKKISKKNKSGSIEEYSIQDLQREINVNLIGSFIMIKHIGSLMVKNRGGSIINIGSDLSINAPDQAVYSEEDDVKNVKNYKPIGYSISKFGIIGLTKYVATYWAHKNVRCNALVPGAVENKQPGFLIKNVIKRIPLRRWAKKYEYRKGLIFLATNDSSYMTGQTLIIDGGRSAW